jgi:hypothetical protein
MMCVCGALDAAATARHLSNRRHGEYSGDG